mgnify:FL=1
MNKLIRMYNQNRGKFWFTFIIIIFIFVMISLFNTAAKKRGQEESEKISEEVSSTEKKQYYNESKSIITGGTVSENLKNDFGNLIDTFLSYCKNHEPEKAYGLLSNECKEVLYPQEYLFEEQYYKNKFSTSKRYSFQSWTSSEHYIYLVKIFDDMLASGKGSSQKYIQDYFSIVQENDDYKLNINSFIGKVNVNKNVNKDNVTITVKNKYVYMDYSIYTINIKNDSSNTVVLDSRKKAATTYIVDENNVNFEALLYENDSSDFSIEPNSEKQIQVKFSDSYRDSIKYEKMVFSDICLDGINKISLELKLRG